jgi:hypothetical protein
MLWNILQKQFYASPNQGMKISDIYRHILCTMHVKQRILCSVARKNSKTKLRKCKLISYISLIQLFLYKNEIRRVFTLLYR